MSTKKSFASNEVYVEVQAKVVEETIHIQGEGPYLNRDYGIAEDIEVNEDVVEYLTSLPHSKKSLANTGVDYIGLQFRPYPKSLHFQVKGKKLNRPYGAAFDTKVVKSLIDFYNITCGK